MDVRETLYPLTPAAQRVGLSKDWLRILCQRGKVEHVRDASGRYLVPERSLERLIEQRRKRR